MPEAGIMFLHSKKSMHCDIKEANVMISGDTDWLNPSHGRCFSHRLCTVVALALVVIARGLRMQ